MLNDTKNNKRIAKNTLMLYFRMILTMLVSLYTSRVVLNVLGVNDYGTYNVVGGVVTMFGFLNGAMVSATQRFLSYDIGRNDYIQLRKTFNATLIIHIVIAFLIILLAETIGLWFVNNQLNLPKSRMGAALWVYHFAVLSFMVSVLRVPFNSIIIAHERMKIYAYISILEVLLKLLIVFMLNWITFDKLKLYGVLIFGVTLIIASIYWIYTRKNFVESRFEVVKDKKLYKELISYSGWSLFGNFAAVTKGQGVNIILNIFFGTVINAAQAISNQIQATVQGFVSNFQMAVNPQIIKSYANQEKKYLTSLIFRSANFSFYLMYLLSLPIILEVEQILKLWLKIVPDYAPVFTILTLVVILITCITGPLTTAIQATGKISGYQSIAGTLQILILPISYFLLKFGFKPLVPFYITIAIEIIALFICLFFASRLIGFSILSFFKEVISKNILIIFLTFPSLLFIRNMLDANIVRLIIIISISLLWTSIIIYAIGLKKSEKLIIINNIKKKMKNYKYL